MQYYMFKEANDYFLLTLFNCGRRVMLLDTEILFWVVEYILIVKDFNNWCIGLIFK